MFFFGGVGGVFPKNDQIIMARPHNPLVSYASLGVFNNYSNDMVMSERCSNSYTVGGAWQFFM